MTLHEELSSAAPIRLPEILSALSFALDLTEGAVPGHALRTTLLGMRIGDALQLPPGQMDALYYALQLKDVGCSSNAARVAQIFAGDDRAAKAMTKLTDWTGLKNALGGQGSIRHRYAELGAGLRSLPRNARLLWSVVEPGTGLRDRFRRIATLSEETEANSREVIQLRCDRGATVLRKLRMTEEACDSVRHLDELWDGSGYPQGLQGQAIPLLARISSVAQNLDVFCTAFGFKEAIRTLKRRSGSWFDPEIVSAALALNRQGVLWKDCEPGCSVDRTRACVVSMSRRQDLVLDAAEIDAICEAFADVVDAKSPFTFRHSVGVMEAASALSRELGLPHAQQQLIRRAALLHDIGKLGIPNSILDKPGKLTDAERRQVMEHPRMSETILGRISGFGDLARIAGQHHEKLDGTGYPRGLTASELSLESRLLTVADCFSALVEERPYRGPVPVDRVMKILAEESPAKLDASLLEVLKAVVGGWQGVLPPVFKAGEIRFSCELTPYTTGNAEAYALV